jgi:hypothetical protein
MVGRSPRLAPRPPGHSRSLEARWCRNRPTRRDGPGCLLGLGARDLPLVAVTARDLWPMRGLAGVQLAMVRGAVVCQGAALQATAARLSTPCVTRAYAAVLVAAATVIPRISLTEPVGEHQIRRSVQRVQPVRQNPYLQVNVLPGVRHKCHSPVPSGQSVRKL